MNQDKEYKFSHECLKCGMELNTVVTVEVSVEGEKINLVVDEELEE